MSQLSELDYLDGYFNIRPPETGPKTIAFTPHGGVK
jgi:hypothetical protein